VHESIILSLPPSTCTARTIAILLHVYCAIYDAPPTPLVYAIHHTILVIAISCKGQLATQRHALALGTGRVCVCRVSGRRHQSADKGQCLSSTLNRFTDTWHSGRAHSKMWFRRPVEGRCLAPLTAYLAHCVEALF